MAAARLIEELALHGPVLTDGAWGTELTRRGLPAGMVPEQWNLENPDGVRSVASAYVDAGADIILTNTFGGSPAKLGKAGIQGDVAEINQRAAELSREAAGDRVFVFASIGPTGELMEPLGTLSEADAIAGFALQVKACAAGGADAILVESMIELGEAKAAMSREVNLRDSLCNVICPRVRTSTAGRSRRTTTRWVVFSRRWEASKLSR